MQPHGIVRCAGKLLLIFGSALLGHIPVWAGSAIEAVETHTAIVDGISWTYVVKDGHAELGGGRRTVQAVDEETAGAISIPSQLGDYPVTSIGAYAFLNCKGITDVVLPASVTHVGMSAFCGATGLGAITLPPTVTSLGAGVFEECTSLTNVTLSASLTEIPDACFAWCESLESIVIPAQVTVLGKEAFNGCDALTEIVFLGAPPADEGSELFDIVPPPAILCRTAYLARFRAIAAEGQAVYTYDGSGLSPVTESVAFGTVGKATRDHRDVVFENTSARDVIVTGFGYGGFSESPIETFDDSASVDGWTLYPTSWGVKDGVLSARANGNGGTAYYNYALMPDVCSNVTVQADIYQHGDDSYAHGIALRTTADFTCSTGDGWRFQIASGYYMVYCRANDVDIYVTDWVESSAIVEGGTNTLTVSVRGNDYNFFINGQKVWSGTYRYLPGPGHIGFFNYASYSRTTYVDVDNLRVVEDAYRNVISDDTTDSFAIDADFPFSVKPGGRVTVPLAFQPVRTGYQGATIGLLTAEGASDGVTAFGTGAEDDLSLVSRDAALFSGHTGGPFAPSTVALVISNSYRLAQSFSVAAPEWLSVTPTDVTLAAGGKVTLTAVPTKAAESQPTARHEEEVVLHHAENGYDLRIPATLYCYTTAKPVLPEETLVVTNVHGQVSRRQLTVRNDATSDGDMTVQIGASETSRQIPSPGVMTAATSPLAALTNLFVLAEGRAFSPTRIMVRFKTDRLRRFATSVHSTRPSLALAAERLLGAKVLHESRLVGGLVTVELPAPVGQRAAMEALIRRFNALEEVLYAEPDYEVKAIQAPNDPKYPELWGMKNTGQTGGTAGADISAEAAWNVTKGSKDVIVAVIDTGIDYTHPDLADNMWVNKGEIPGNGIDDDGNGYVDDVYGINAITGSGDPKDDHYHGTHCAGTIGGVGNNGVGVAGVCWKVRLMAAKFLNSGGSGNTSDAVKCVDYCVANGAKVLSNSWGGGGYNQALKDAIDAANEAGVVFVAAAGNDYSNTDNSPNYPSCYECENIISVVASTHDDTKANFSNWGVKTCDIVAPGVDIVSCSPGGGYRTLSGTSMATPHVAGACGLLCSLNPSLKPAEMLEILMATGDDVPALAQTCASGRRMNVAKAVMAVGTWAKADPEVLSGIAPGDAGETTIVFDAGDLDSGTYDGRVTATALDEEGTVATMPIRMVILPDDLTLLSSNAYTFTWREGSPAGKDEDTFVFRNDASKAVRWSADVGEAGEWIELEPASGTVPAGETVSVKIRIKSSEALGACSREATLWFRNLDLGSVYRRSVSLQVSLGTGPLYVDPQNGDDANHGRLEKYPMRTLAGALAHVTEGTDIRLADGVYGPVVATGGVSFSITGVNGCRGVFIDGGNTNRCCTLIADTDYLSSSRVTNVLVRGVTLMRGRAEGTGSRRYGGAAYGGLFEDCRLVGSYASSGGGGACRAVLRRTELSGNRCENSYGGGGACYTDLDYCTVAGNVSGEYGTGTAYCTVRNSIVWGNTTIGGYSSSQVYSSSPENSLTDQDPHYRNPSIGMYTLTAESPRTDIGCYLGVDDKVYLGAKVIGTGFLKPAYAYPDGSGKVALEAVELTRPFVRWETEEGETVGEDRLISLSVLTENTVLRAVFAEYTIYADATQGDDANDGTSEEGAVATLDRAIGLSEPGETIVAASGVYGPIATDGKRVTVRGAGVGHSVIDGGGTARCATLGTSTNGTVLVGFTLRNGCANNGGGAYYGRLVACELTDNVATNNGGGACYTRLESCVIAKNRANYGGGLYYGYAYNCSVVGNRATGAGSSCVGGVYGTQTYNSVVSGNRNSAEEISNLNYANAYNCRYSAEEYGLVDASHGDARLRTGSSLIDKGNASYVVCDIDVLGNPRVSGSAVDIGAYEGAGYDGLVIRTAVSGTGRVVPETALCDAGGSATFTAQETDRAFVRFETNGVFVTGEPTVTFANVSADFTLTAVFARKDVYVDASAAADGDGFTADTPLRTLQDGVNLACAGETVHVAEGVYAPIDAGIKRLTIVATGARDRTVIDGGGVSRCAKLGLSTSSGSSLTGFTLRNGHSTDGYAAGAYYGTLTNCLVVGNRTYNPNSSQVYGGGTYYSDLVRCEVVGNVVSNYHYACGGGSYYGTAVNTVFSNNTSFAGYYAYGGGMYDGTSHSCLFARNVARRTNSYTYSGYGAYGGGTYSGYHYNATVAYNEIVTTMPSDGSNCSGMSSSSAYNCIVYGNASTGKTTAQHSENNYVYFTDDPCFVNPDEDDFRLTRLSKALNSANASNARTPYDLAGNPRLSSDGRVSYGCYQDAVDGEYVHAAVKGAGSVSRSITAIGADGRVTVRAIEGNRRFLRWTDEAGNVLGTELELSLSNLSGLVTVTAEFEILTHYVDAEKGNDANDGLTPATAFRTIDAGLAAAEPGEEVVAASGVYGPITAGGKRVTVRGAGIGESIIDGGGTSRCATLGISTNGTALVGFTLRNGRAERGGGAYYGRLVACELTDNVATNYGGGAYNSRLENCLVLNNTVREYGSGTYNCWNYNCTLVGNQSCVSNYWSGCGVYGGYSYNCAAQYNVTAAGEYSDYYNCSTYNSCQSGTNDMGFVDREGGDFRLLPGSRLIDKGSKYYYLPATDILGSPRVQGAAVDCGAYEGAYYGEAPAAPANLLVSVGRYDEIGLDWSVVTERLSCYVVYRASKPDGSDAEVLAYPNATNYVDRAISVDTDYYYAVAAYNSSGEARTDFVLGRALKPLSLDTEDLPDGVTGQNYEFALQASGGKAPYRWNIVRENYVSSQGGSGYGSSGTLVWDGNVDDNYVQLDLPFAFPFYSGIYTRVAVNSNGALMFKNYASTIFSNADSIRGAACICALGADLRMYAIVTNCTQDALTITVAGCYRNDTSAIVNYSYTLHADGRIELGYGMGNANGGIVGISGGKNEKYCIPYATSPGSMFFHEGVMFTPTGDVLDDMKISASGVLTGVAADRSGTVTIVVTDADGTNIRRTYALDVGSGQSATSTTEVPIPYAWIDGLGLLGEGNHAAADYESAAGAIGANGIPVWESYVAGLVPTNENSRFKAFITIGSDGKPIVSWEPKSAELDATRTYTTLGAENLGDEMKDISAMTDEECARMRFFRVRVELNPTP